ncbi:MAG: hypothetical protein ABEJ67_01575 [Halanaeroarchaeum sp.]
MRTYRFVRFLGDRVEIASRDVAATAEQARSATERLPSSDDADPHGLVRRELPRTIAGAVDGHQKGPTRLSATTVTVAEDRPPGSPELGVVVQVSVPDFEHVNAMVATAVDGRALADPEFSLAESNESAALDRLLAITADAFVLVVTDQRVQVVPAQSVVAMTDPSMRQRPHRELYARRLGRTVEEFAEGFVGDSTVAPDLSASDARSETVSAVRTWAETNDLAQVLWIGVAVEDESAATLRDFV